jgi:hypothetical protein
MQHYRLIIKEQKILLASLGKRNVKQWFARHEIYYQCKNYTIAVTCSNRASHNFRAEPN